MSIARRGRGRRRRVPVEATDREAVGRLMVDAHRRHGLRPEAVYRFFGVQRLAGLVGVVRDRYGGDYAAAAAAIAAGVVGGERDVARGGGDVAPAGHPQAPTEAHTSTR